MSRGDKKNRERQRGESPLYGLFQKTFGGDPRSPLFLSLSFFTPLSMKVPPVFPPYFSLPPIPGDLPFSRPYFFYPPFQRIAPFHPLSLSLFLMSSAPYSLFSSSLSRGCPWGGAAVWSSFLLPHNGSIPPSSSPSISGVYRQKKNHPSFDGWNFYD